MTEHSDPILIDIDTTMMTPTEVLIIKSHLRAINAVVEGAKPQGNPEPVPEWRLLVNGAARANWPHPLATVLSSLANIDGYSDDECYDPRDDLARIVAVCEQQVGDGWQADPGVTLAEYDCVESHADGLPCVGCLIDALTASAPAKWKHLGNRAAAWLRDLTEDTQ